jgi:hypothetical protein
MLRKHFRRQLSVFLQKPVSGRDRSGADWVPNARLAGGNSSQ